MYVYQNDQHTHAARTASDGVNKIECGKECQFFVKQYLAGSGVISLYLIIITLVNDFLALIMVDVIDYFTYFLQSLTGLYQ